MPMKVALSPGRIMTGRVGDELALWPATAMPPYVAADTRAWVRKYDLAARGRSGRRASLRIPQGLDSIGLHECRHTYAAFMIAAKVNAKALSSYMGHSTITVTLDRYGHLLPGNEREAAALLDYWLAGAD
jgi:integrase